jgi:hypothetical protein
MSSTAKKRDKGKSSTKASLPLSKDTAPHSSTKMANSKIGESKSDPSKAVEQVNPKLLVSWIMSTVLLKLVIDLYFKN